MEKEMAAHSSVLARRIPGTEEPGRLQSMRSHRVGHDSVTNTHMEYFTVTTADFLKYLLFKVSEITFYIYYPS